MARFILTKLAASDSASIADHSIKAWGQTRTESYVSTLKQTFQRVADFPGIGQNASEIRVGYMRMPIASHVVFYRKIDAGVQIVRVLHERMDFARHVSS